MKTILLKLWNDPTYFTAVCRGAVAVFCALVVQGIIVFPVGSKAAWFAAVIVGAASIGWPAGQKNRPPEEIKAIAVDPTVVPNRGPNPGNP